MEPKILESIGLTKNESIVYLTLSKIGTSKVGELLKNSNLNSGRIYETLDSLENKGLVSESVINHVRHFTAAPPSRLFEYLNRKKEKIESEEKEIQTIIPQLETLRKISKKEVKAVTYTGFNGFKTAVNEATDSLNEKEEIVSMGISKIPEKKFNIFWKQWYAKIKRKKLRVREIFSKKDDYYNEFKKMPNTDARFLPAITPVAVDVYGSETVLIFNYEPPYSFILIQDKNTATSFKNLFEQLWNQANV